MSKRRCAGANCPKLVPVGTRYCPNHQAQYDARRGTPRQRGYDRDYWRARARAKRAVDAGGVTCWRCGQPIEPDSNWHMGHDDEDRTILRGPEHASCNLSAAGRASHRWTDR